MTNWVVGPYVCQTKEDGWCVRLDGTDIFGEANDFGNKASITFELVRGLKTQEEAEAFLHQWAKNLLPKPTRSERIAKLEQDPAKKAALDRAREKLKNGEITFEVEDITHRLEDSDILEWMLDEPEGAQHLLNLLSQGKGTKDDFRKMVNRIRASAEKEK